MPDAGLDRKRQLVLKSRLLRARLIHHAGPLAHSLAATESALRVLGRVRQHPEWLLGAALALALLRPGRISAWMRGTALGMRTWRRVVLPFLPLLTSFRSSSPPSTHSARHRPPTGSPSPLTELLQTILQTALRR